MKPLPLFLLLGAALALGFALNLLTGPADVNVLAALGGGGSAMDQAIALDIRLPRTLLVCLVGASVAMAGAAIQGLFRNPLADPALIGVSAGAAFCAALFLVFAPATGWLRGLGAPVAAFAGGLLATFMVVAIGRRGSQVSTMLLAGIAINAMALAGLGLVTFMADDASLRTVAFWALGSFSGSNWQGVMVALLLLPVLGMLYLEHRRLDLLTLGDREAALVGVEVQKLRSRVVVYCALLVGIGVALAGVISFIGLVVPHVIRLMQQVRHGMLLPLSGLLGALMLLLADALGRVVVAPAELPVGILTALVGGPFFVYLVVINYRRFSL